MGASGSCAAAVGKMWESYRSRSCQKQICRWQLGAEICMISVLGVKRLRRRGVNTGAKLQPQEAKRSTKGHKAWCRHGYTRERSRSHLAAYAS